MELSRGSARRREFARPGGALRVKSRAQNACMFPRAYYCFLAALVAASYQMVLDAALPLAGVLAAAGLTFVSLGLARRP
jgi:hypothetical protein